MTWGTGPGLVETFVRELNQYIKENRVTYLPRHRVNELHKKGKQVTHDSGEILAPSHAKRGEKSNRKVIDEYIYDGESIVVASGVIGGNFDLIRVNWPIRLVEALYNIVS